jgi:hypothetical protein
LVACEAEHHHDADDPEGKDEVSTPSAIGRIVLPDRICGIDAGAQADYQLGELDWLRPTRREHEHNRPDQKAYGPNQQHQWRDAISFHGSNATARSKLRKAVQTISEMLDGAQSSYSGCGVGMS